MAALTAPVLVLGRFLCTGGECARDLVTGRRVWIRRSQVASPVERTARASCAAAARLVRARSWVPLIASGPEGRSGWIDVFDVASRPRLWRGPSGQGRQVLGPTARAAEAAGLSIFPASRRFVVVRNGRPALLPVPGVVVRERAPLAYGAGPEPRQAGAPCPELDALDDALGAVPVRDVAPVTIEPPSSAAAPAFVGAAADRACVRGFVALSSRWFSARGSGAKMSHVLRVVLRYRHAVVFHVSRQASGRAPRGDDAIVRTLAALRVRTGLRALLVRVIARPEDAHPGGLRYPLPLQPASAVCEAREAYAASVVVPVQRSDPPRSPSVASVVRRVDDLCRRGRHAEAANTLQRAIAEARRRRRWAASAALSIVLGRLRQSRGRVADAERAFSSARDWYREAGSPRGAVQATLHGAWLLVDDNRLDEGDRAFRAALAAAEQLGSAEAAREAVLGRAHAAYWLDSPFEARALLLNVSRFDALAPASGSVAEARGGCGWTEDIETCVLRPAIRLDVLQRLIELRVGRALGSARPGSCSFAGGGRASGSGAATPMEASLVCEADMLEAAAAGQWAAVDERLADGLRAARAARVPLLALSLRLTYAECRREADAGFTPAEARGVLRWERVPVPGLLRRRLIRLAAPRPDRRTDVEPGTSTHGPRLAPGIVGLLRALNDAGDERAGLTRACESCRELLGAAAVTIFNRTSLGLRVCASSGGRPCDAPAAARAVDAGLTIEAGPSNAARVLATPVAFAGTTIGAVVARWGDERGPDDSAAALLEALAAACASSVRALVDESLPGPDERGPAGTIMGCSEATAELRALVLRAAVTPFPVLIQGESGTGKELAARAIHAASPRASRRLCAVNCAALAEDLVEAELFGSARGAYTGAISDRPGLFEEADGGTLFLDEIAELSPRAQAKLLRVIQEGEVRRLGENVHRAVDVRLMAATNHPLAEECRRGRFRQDLFYRLDVIRIVVAPLRERPEDIPLLIARFWTDTSRRAGSRAVLAQEALGALARYEWPGNVRQLQNTLAALAVRAPRVGRIGLRDIKAVLPSAAGAGSDGRDTLDHARRRFEARYVAEALARAGGHRARAAAELGITRQGLAKLVARLGIDLPESQAEGA